MIDETQIENDREIPADIRTSRILVEIGNGICEFIKLSSSGPGPGPRSGPGQVQKVQGLRTKDLDPG